MKVLNIFKKRGEKNEKVALFGAGGYGSLFTSSLCCLGRRKEIGLILATGG
jgi:hypothetical protein